MTRGGTGSGQQARAAGTEAKAASRGALRGLAAALGRSIDARRLVGMVGLLLAFAAVPAADLVIYRWVEYVAGTWLALAAAVVVAAAGGLVAVEQGARAVARLRDPAASPEGPVADLVGIALASVLLVTPGFLTDLCGIALLVPPLRRACARALGRAAERHAPAVRERLRLALPKPRARGGRSRA